MIVQAGWIVMDAIVRTREKYGTFRADQYPLFCTLVAVTIRWERPDAGIAADLCDGVLRIDPNLPEREQAFAAWHELGHVVLHEGDRRDLEGTFDGEAAIRKYERQSDEFARAFPSWD